MENKKTKKEYFTELIEVVRIANVEGEEDYVAFLEKQIELVDNKAAKAKEKAKEKKEKGDELRALVESKLTDEYQPIATIVDAIGDEEVTTAKVVNRLTALIKAGIAEKDKVKVEEGGKPISVYRLIQETEE